MDKIDVIPATAGIQFFKTIFYDFNNWL